MQKLPPDFCAFLKLLNEQGVEYLLVGGYAVAIHGHPRFTADMDIWVAVSQANAERIVQALEIFGFGGPHLKPEIFLSPDQMTKLGREPMKIEILNSVSGLEFDGAWSRAMRVEIDGVQVPVISLADLRTNKTASARPQDLADLDNLPED